MRSERTRGEWFAVEHRASVRHRIVGSETYGGEEMLLLGDIGT